MSLAPTTPNTTKASFEKYRITLENLPAKNYETNVETQTTAKLFANTQNPKSKPSSAIALPCRG